MAEDNEKLALSKTEELLKGKLVCPRPGHSFDQLDLDYLARVGARVEATMAPEEGASK